MIDIKQLQTILDLLITNDMREVVNNPKDNRGEISKKTKSNLVNVFIPTTPNPTSGFLLLVPENELTYLDVNVDDAIKTVFGDLREAS